MESIIVNDLTLWFDAQEKRRSPGSWNRPMQRCGLPLMNGTRFDYNVETEEHNARHDLSEARLWEIAGHAAQAGASREIHFLGVPQAVLLERLTIRNAHLPLGVMYIPEEKVKGWITFFQTPTPNELERRE